MAAAVLPYITIIILYYREAISMLADWLKLCMLSLIIDIRVLWPAILLILGFSSKINCYVEANEKNSMDKFVFSKIFMKIHL